MKPRKSILKNRNDAAVSGARDSSPLQDISSLTDDELMDFEGEIGSSEPHTRSRDPSISSRSPKSVCEYACVDFSPWYSSISEKKYQFQLG